MSMTDLYPLLDRDRYTDDEWKLAVAGLCGWVTEYGMHMGRIVHCGQLADPRSFYRCCAKHDAEAREHPTYGT